MDYNQIVETAYELFSIKDYEKSLSLLDEVDELLNGDKNCNSAAFTVCLEAEVKLDVGPEVKFSYKVDTSDTVTARQIRHPVPSLSMARASHQERHGATPPLSAETVVRYLVRTYGESSGRFLFHETQKAGFIRALRAHRPPNYLFSHLATELASLPAPADGKCRPSLFHDVAGLIAKCLRTPAGRRNLETAMVVDCIPRPLRDRFDKQFLADLQDRFGRAQTAFHALGGEISRLEQNFFEASGSSVATYLAAVAPPLAFLDRANELGQVSRVFKSKVKGGVFPVENLSVATLSHFWPELGVALPRLSPAEAGRLRSQACRAIRGEIHRLLEAPPPEAKKAPSGREGAILQGLEKLCRSHDLKHAVLYFTGKEFVCFREDEVFADIARKNTEKYPTDFVAKMKKRRGATLPSPLLNAPPSPSA